MTRPAFTLVDIPMTVILAGLGAFLGAGAVGGIVLVYQGTWVALLLIIAIFIFQALGQGILHLIVWGLACLWAVLRQRPIPQRPPSMPAKDPAAGPQPWLKDRAFTIGFAIAFVAVFALVLIAGAFEDWGQ